MPDVEFKTISASQAAGLFEVSPYITRRGIFDFLHDHIDVDEKENESMKWGKVVQPFILGRASDRLNLVAVPNEKDEYVRHKELPIGCTLDAHLTCPARGFGVIEAKAVRWQVHKADWTATAAPVHIEVQLQHQMLTMGAEWGAIAVMVGANEDFQILERRPNPQVYEQLAREAKAMAADVAAHKRPPVFGEAVELKALEHLYPIIKPSAKHEDMTDLQLSQWVREFHQAGEAESFNRKWREQLKTKILDKSGEAGLIRVYGALAKVSRSAVPASTVTLPAEIRSGLVTFMRAMSYLDKESLLPFPVDDLAPVTAAMNWTKVTRAAHNRTELKVEPITGDPEPPAEDIGWNPGG